jgi:hypothetical protein
VDLALERVVEDQLPIVRGNQHAEPGKMSRDVRQHRPHAIVLRQRTLAGLELDARVVRRLLHPRGGPIAAHLAVQDDKSTRHHAAFRRSLALSGPFSLNLLRCADRYPDDTKQDNCDGNSQNKQR